MSTLHDFPTLDDLGDRLGPMIQRQLYTFFSAFPGTVVRERDRDWVSIITGEPHPFGNLALLAETGDAALAAIAVEPLVQVGQPAALLFCGRPSPDAERVATDAGFTLAERMPAMAIPIEDLAPTPLPEGYTFCELDGDADRPWCRTFAAGYGIPQAIADMFGPAAAAAADHLEMRYYGLARGDELVATSLLMLEGGLAGIYSVATLPDERGKGLGAVATAEPLRRMRERGYRTGILQSSAMGESVYRRLGFQDHGVLLLYVRMPGDAEGTTSA